jgi:fructokinase
MSEQYLVLGIGELLWDVLPDGARLGGAPANFAVMAGRLGDRAAILSRVGRDELGRDAIVRLGAMPVETRFVQVDPEHATGRVTVSFRGGETLNTIPQYASPQYAIQGPAAWDFLEHSDEWVLLAERADAICFGSLAQRSPDSRAAIQNLVESCREECVRICDVNLRAPFYSAEVIEESLELATVVKMNEDEVPIVMRLLGQLDLGLEEKSAGPNRGPGAEDRAAGDFLRRAAERLLAEFPALELVAVTKGARGSLLVTRGEWHEHAGFPVEVADAVGAGDAFTAAMTHYLLRGADLATLNEAGNRWGSWVASQAGAMPALPDGVREAITKTIERVGG